MKYLLYFLLALPFSLGAQCYGSFEVFGAAGLSDYENTFFEDFAEQKPVFVNRFGFGASIRLGQRTYLRTGMQFNQYGNRYVLRELRWGTQHDGNGGFDPNAPGSENLPGVITQRDRFVYLEGMAAFRYQFPSYRSPWQPFVEAGLNVGKYGFTRSNSELHFSDRVERDQSNGTEPDLRPWSFIGRLGAGTNYNFNDHLGVYAMVVGQRHLQNLVRERTRSVFPWQATLEVGVRVFVDPR